MKIRNSKFIFWLMGLGSGMILSGIIGAIFVLNLNEYKTAVSNINQSKTSTESAVAASEESIAAPEITPDETMPASEQIQTVDAESEVPVQTPEEVPSATPASEESSQEELLEIDIPSYFTAMEISKLLEEKHVVDDWEKFKDFMREQKMTTKLKAGKHLVPLNASYEEVLASLV